MNREAYELANRIETELGTDGITLTESPGDVKTEKYKKYILQQLQRERQVKRRKTKGIYAAACAVLILLSGTVFLGDELHAMIRQLRWNIGSALGISEDLADYSEMVNTSVVDRGYVVTLQEALVSEGELMVNYTLQREDGEPMDELDRSLWIMNGDFYINGEKINCTIEAGSDFLDEERKVLGVMTKYFLFHTPDIDLAQENEYRMEFDQIGVDGGVKGNWNFAFKADSSALMGDTIRTELGKNFMLPDGVSVTLEEFSTNHLEQRISYSLSGRSRYSLVVEAVDSEGNQVEFSTRTQGDSGYMLNQTCEYYAETSEKIYRRLDENAETVTMTLYTREELDENGQVGDDYVQIGEPFEVKLR